MTVVWAGWVAEAGQMTVVWAGWVTEAGQMSVLELQPLEFKSAVKREVAATWANSENLISKFEGC